MSLIRPLVWTWGTALVFSYSVEDSVVKAGIGGPDCGADDTQASGDLHNLISLSSRQMASVCECTDTHRLVSCRLSNIKALHSSVSSNSRALGS